MEGAYINMRLILLLPYLNKRMGYFKTVDRKQEIRNREIVPYSFFGV